MKQILFKPVTNKLRVLHYPQVPCTPFFVEVKSEEEAFFIQKTLADQHLYLFDNNLIDDYANSILVVMWNEEEQDWEDYYNEDEAMEFDELVETYLNT